MKSLDIVERIVYTNLKSVYEPEMLVKLIKLAALPRVVVAIGSYVAGIFYPLIPYSAKDVPAAK